MTWLYSKKPNYSVLRDPILDQLYEEALRTYNPAKASALWKKLERYIYDKHLLLIGYQQPTVFGVNKRLHFTPRVLTSFWDAYYER
jgi:ABC-type transport system substrate-binding protein